MSAFLWHNAGAATEQLDVPAGQATGSAAGTSSATAAGASVATAAGACDGTSTVTATGSALNMRIDVLDVVASSTDGSSFATNSVTPDPNALLVLLVVASDTFSDPTTVSNSGTALTWTRRTGTPAFPTYGSSGQNTVHIFTAQAGASPGSMVVTWSCTGDDATGAVLCLLQVRGHNRTSPIVQTDAQDNGSGANPAITIPSAVGTFNAYIAFFGISRSAPAATPPSGWTEAADTGYSTPSNGMAAAFRVNGETSATFTFTASGDAGGNSIMLVEILVGPREGDGSSSGTSTATATGLHIGTGAGSAAGTSTVSGVAADPASSGSAAGTSSAAAIGASVAATVASDAGTSTSAAIGASTAAVDASAAGTSIASAAGSATSSSFGDAAGASTTTGTGASTSSAVASTAASSTVSAIGSATAAAGANAAGTCIASAVGNGIVSSTASASGVDTSTAIGHALFTGSGIATGSCTVSGTSYSTGSEGIAAGTCVVVGVGSVLQPAVAFASGTSTCSAVGVLISDGVGLASSTCSVVGMGSAVITGAGTITSTCTVGGSGFFFGNGQPLLMRNIPRNGVLLITIKPDRILIPQSGGQNGFWLEVIHGRRGRGIVLRAPVCYVLENNVAARALTVRTPPMSDGTAYLISLTYDDVMTAQFCTSDEMGGEVLAARLLQQTQLGKTNGPLPDVTRIPVTLM